MVKKTRARAVVVVAAGLVASAAAFVDKCGDDAVEGVLTPKSPLAGYVLRAGGTEPAWTSDLNGVKRSGTYVCAGCRAALFPSTTKYESGTGWPSFWDPVVGGAVTVASPGLLSSLFGREVKCAKCKGHLGHRFADGPKQTTGERYCINGAALRFHDGPPPQTPKKGLLVSE